MKLYVEITADMNDGDYAKERTVITDEEIQRIIDSTKFSSL